MLKQEHWYDPRKHTLSGDTTPYGHFIQSQVEFISGLTDEYLFHEYLEAENQPYWFQEFIQLLDSNGLQYLGDTDLSSMMNVHWPEETKEVLNHISPTQYELEQYMDMLRCRRFRCSLFVHHEQTVNRNIEPHSFQSLYFSYKAHDKWTSEDVTEAPMEADDPVKLYYSNNSIVW